MYKGITLRKKISHIEDFFTALDNLNIECVELPYEIWTDKELSKILSKFKHLRLYACSLIEDNILESLPGQKYSIITDFKREMNDKINLLGEKGVTSISMNIPFEKILTDNIYYDTFVYILKSFHHSLYLNNMTLCFNIAIPIVKEEEQKRLLSFLKEFMSPYYKISTDIYVHKLPKNFNPEVLAKWIKFDTGILRYVYEPELGNYLVPPLIEPWEHFFSKISPYISIMLAPYVSKLTTLKREIKANVSVRI